MKRGEHIQTRRGLSFHKHTMPKAVALHCPHLATQQRHALGGGRGQGAHKSFWALGEAPLCTLSHLILTKTMAKAVVLSL